ncbi:hypothetical protein HDU80_002031 [Chytriomyces hyalinus]|nr:hypothetical protein HDU80_002031 [Chytriomyces hyalinus]
MDGFIDDSKEAQVLTVVIGMLENLPEDESTSVQFHHLIQEAKELLLTMALNKINMAFNFDDDEDGGDGTEAMFALPSASDAEVVNDPAMTQLLIQSVTAVCDSLVHGGYLQEADQVLKLLASVGISIEASLPPNEVIVPPSPIHEPVVEEECRPMTIEAPPRIEAPVEIAIAPAVEIIATPVEIEKTVAPPEPVVAPVLKPKSHAKKRTHKPEPYIPEPRPLRTPLGIHCVVPALVVPEDSSAVVHSIAGTLAHQALHESDEALHKQSNGNIMHESSHYDPTQPFPHSKARRSFRKDSANVRADEFPKPDATGSIHPSEDQPLAAAGQTENTKAAFKIRKRKSATADAILGKKSLEKHLFHARSRSTEGGTKVGEIFDRRSLPTRNDSRNGSRKRETESNDTNSSNDNENNSNNAFDAPFVVSAGDLGSRTALYNDLVRKDSVDVIAPAESGTDCPTEDSDHPLDKGELSEILYLQDKETESMHLKNQVPILDLNLSEHNEHNTEDPNVNDHTKSYAGDVVSLVDPINEQQSEPPLRSSPVDTNQAVALSSVSQTSMMVDAFINNDSMYPANLENELAIVKTPDEITEVDLQNAKGTGQELTLDLMETNEKGSLSLHRTTVEVPPAETLEQFSSTMVATSSSSIAVPDTIPPRSHSNQQLSSDEPFVHSVIHPLKSLKSSLASIHSPSMNPQAHHSQRRLSNPTRHSEIGPTTDATKHLSFPRGVGPSGTRSADTLVSTSRSGRKYELPPIERRSLNALNGITDFIHGPAVPRDRMLPKPDAEMETIPRSNASAVSLIQHITQPYNAEIQQRIVVPQDVGEEDWLVDLSEPYAADQVSQPDCGIQREHTSFISTHERAYPTNHHTLKVTQHESPLRSLRGPAMLHHYPNLTLEGASLPLDHTPHFRAGTTPASFLPAITIPHNHRPRKTRHAVSHGKPQQKKDTWWLSIHPKSLASLGFNSCKSSQLQTIAKAVVDKDRKAIRNEETRIRASFQLLLMHASSNSLNSDAF